MGEERERQSQNIVESSTTWYNNCLEMMMVKEQPSTWSSSLAPLPPPCRPPSPVCPFHTFAINPVRSSSLPFSLPTLPDIVTTCQSDVIKEAFEES